MKWGSKMQNPVSRKTDPISSYLAEDEINKTGTRASQQAKILAAVKLNPGRTSRELVDYCLLDRYQIARRLADLKESGAVIQGPIRKCRVGGRKSVTWFVTPSRAQLTLFERG
jgi:predicted HTH transcriptional regulator